MTKNKAYIDFCNEPQVREELNNTTHLLLPSIEIPIRFSVLRQNGFINAYIDDAENEDFYMGCLFLLFNPSEITESYRDFEKFMRSLDNYITDYDVGYNKVMFVIRVKDKWMSNLRMFKRSKYSEFDDEYVKTFFSPVIKQGEKTIPNKYYQILTKDPEYKKKLEYYLGHLDGKELNPVYIPEENELASPINHSREVFNYKS